MAVGRELGELLGKRGIEVRGPVDSFLARPIDPRCIFRLYMVGDHPG
jgi:hypothetical protein